MISPILLSASVLSASVSALPSYGTLQPYGKSIAVDANFDDLTAIPVLNDLTPIGPYKYVDWEGLSAGSEYIPLAGVQLFGVTPSSPPNYAYSSPITELFGGPSINADYSGSKTKAFSLHSFYYACVDIDSTPVATPENCTVTVTGYKGDTLVATQSFDYGEDVLPFRVDLDAPMLKARLNHKFRFLTKVEITYDQAQPIDTPPAFLGDDFWYTVYLKK